jgi:hypothetical protein
MAKDALPPTVAEALKSGNKIEAIKRLRGITGLGLKEAKDWIDNYERGGPAPLPEIAKNIPADARFAAHPHAAHVSRPGLSPGEVARSGGAGKWLALIAVAVLVVLVVLYR